MSQNPEIVLFVRRAMYFSQTGERWFWSARHAAIVDRYRYRSAFHGASQAFCRLILGHIFHRNALKLNIERINLLL